MKEFNLSACFRRSIVLNCLAYGEGKQSACVSLNVILCSIRAFNVLRTGGTSVTSHRLSALTPTHFDTSEGPTGPA